MVQHADKQLAQSDFMCSGKLSVEYLKCKCKCKNATENVLS